MKNPWSLTTPAAEWFLPLLYILQQAILFSRCLQRAKVTEWLVSGSCHRMACVMHSDRTKKRQEWRGTYCMIRTSGELHQYVTLVLLIGVRDWPCSRANLHYNLQLQFRPRLGKPPYYWKRVCYAIRGNTTSCIVVRWKHADYEELRRRYRSMGFVPISWTLGSDIGTLGSDGKSSDLDLLLKVVVFVSLLFLK